MKNTFGNSIALTLFGESHGAYIGAVLDGLAPGITINEEFIRAQLDKRRPVGKISTARHEADEFQIVSGVFEGKTTGTPLTVLIPNTAQHSKDYSATRSLARPGHADYTAYAKYHGFEDYRGGGHFSGRVTAALAAAGAILISALREKGIDIGTHIQSCAGVKDVDFSDLRADIAKLNDLDFAVLDSDRGEEMKAAIEAAAGEGDSVGGVLETAVLGMPAGVGEPWFDTVEGVLSHALFSVPAVKGVQFGDAFEMVNGKGSDYNDNFHISDKEIKTKTNHNGGVNGGITNGMPIVFRSAVKPTPSIFKAQDTVDFMKQENSVLELKGRHDPAIIHRARVVIDSVTALAIADLLAQRYGTDWLKK
ncbi:MAG: chorismate synthase [Ruminococcus sp.]|uniref:chorismate synthase n=1 Tax=Ruminococcus sp. TaxID=41978 RepID=UPI0028731933|nr:chorismate synthase [Ruminococcus sp.]MBQ3284919.1 chorismate synthase [Ruminococcus sp.]